MAAPNFRGRTIFTRDCIEVMRGMNSETVDLIYLDPPFNSKQDYAAPIGSQAAGAAFKDTWTLSDIDVEWIDLIERRNPALHRVLLAAMTDSDKSYLAYMAARLLEMPRLLKPTGSIYLHCDPTMSHYLKLVMDAIFGRDQFRNEVIWKRSNRSDGRRFGWVHDAILAYGQGGATWNDVYLPYDDDYVNRFYRERDERGFYKRENLTGAGTTGGESGQPWRGHNPTDGGRHWAAPKSGPYAYWIDTTVIAGYSAIEGVHDRLDALDAAGLIHWPKRGQGQPMLKRYAEGAGGQRANDIFDDIRMISNLSNERVGYPTQKPLALLNRIIKASSNPGDMVLDPFCGCATTCVSAENLGRDWVGIDLSPKAGDLVLERLGAGNRAVRRTDITLRTDIPHRSDLGPLQRPSSPEVKRMLYGQQEGQCGGCDEHFEVRHLEVDHIIARSRGGTDHPANLQLLCGHCNRVKGDRGMAYLAGKLQLAGAAG